MGIIPWPDGLLKLPVPGTSYVLLDMKREENGQLRRDVGQGGMGIVFAAEDTEDPGEQVAIKFPLHSEEDNPAFDASCLEALRAETKRSRRIGTSAHLARAYEPLNLRPYAEWPPLALVMEFLPLTLAELRTLCAHDGYRFSDKQVVEWARQLAEGLHHLHDRHQLIHRDLKPSNVMFRLAAGVAWAGTPQCLNGADGVITDFGTVVRRDGEVPRLVCRTRKDGKDDPYKHPDFYPLHGSNESPKRQQNDPEMDIHAFGQVLRVLGRLCTEGGK